jgi:hypothetical protein
LDDGERQSLLSRFGRLHPTAHLHHLTIKFRPQWDEVRALPLGQEVKLKVIGQLDTDEVQVFVIDPDSLPCECANEVPHITVATARDVPPSYSNHALKDGDWGEVDEFFVTGHVGASLSDGRIIHTSPAIEEKNE